jgi:hypothetical protein
MVPEGFIFGCSWRVCLSANRSGARTAKTGEHEPMQKLGLFLALALLAGPALAGEVDISVGPGGQYQHLRDAVAVANADPNPSNTYVINLAPGVYLNDFPAPIVRPMVIQTDPSIAQTGAVLRATVPLPNAKAILLTFASLTVRGIEFTGAYIDDSLGGNGAAIRDQNPEGTPAALVVDNSLFHDNQAGIVQGDDSAETVTIVNSQFINNGNPDICCFTHGVYIDEAASLTVTGSLFCGQLIGHEVKSRAAQTTVMGSQIYSGEGAPANSGCRIGNASFDIQIANGGVASIRGNQLVQGPSAQNHKIVSYGAEGVNFATNSLSVANNNFVSTANSIAVSDLSYLYVAPCVPVQLAGNTFSGISEIVDPPSCVAPGAPPPPPPPLSPDGSIISGGTGSLQTTDGTWTFGPAAANRPGEWEIFLNGSWAAGGISAELEVANGGQIYAETASGNWYFWQNGGWALTANPNPSSPPPLSPDGSIISGGTGSLQTTNGTWTFGPAAANRPGEWEIFLNGSWAAGGISAELEVANGGQIYAETASGNWYFWQNGGWALTANPNPSSPPPLSPDGSIISGGTGSLQTADGTWTFGPAAANRPGEWEIFLNGYWSAGGISAELEVANGGQMYAETAAGSWFMWQNGGWVLTAKPNPQ